MTALRSIASEIFGLFVEDWRFALAIAGFLAAIVALSALSIGSGSTRALLLVFGPAAILLTSVARARKR